MLKKRIIPCLDISGGRVVKGVKFKDIKNIGNPVDLASYYKDQGADELVVYDISAHKESRGITSRIVTDIKEVFNLPLTVGGGVNSLEDVDRIFKSGADKVSINSGEHKNPGLIKEASNKYGAQSIVGSLDTAYNKELERYEIVTRGGDVRTGIIIDDWIKYLMDQGIGECVVNVIDEDGMKSGFALELMKDISEKFRIPFIASGGAGCAEDFVNLFSQTKCTGGLAASIFHNKTLSINDLKAQLISTKIAVRT